MRMVNWIFEKYDHVAAGLTNRIVSRDKMARRLSKEAQFFSEDLGITKNEAEHYTFLIGKIHERVAALVGHLSIMIAVSMFVLSEVSTNAGRTLIAFEVLAYIALTVFTIRALKTVGIQKDYQDVGSFLESLRQEVVLKFQIQHASLGLTILLTILLFVFTLIAFVLEWLVAG